MTGDATLPMLLRRNAEAKPTRPAMREKRRGIWQTHTWAEYDARVRAFAGGLAAHDFRRGDRLAVLGDNRPKLYWALLAAQALGGTGVPIWPDAEAAWLASALRQAAVAVAVVEDRDQFEKLLSMRDTLPDLRLIVRCDANDAVGDDSVVSFDTILAAGHGVGTDAAAGGQTEDAALILFATRIPGPPRGVVLSHANLLAAARALAAAEDFRATDNCFCFLPMAWVGDAVCSTTLSLLVGFTCNYPEDPESARRDLREIGPEFLVAPPRIWESLLAEIDGKGTQATPLKRRLYTWFRRRAETPAIPAPLRLLGEMLIGAPARDQIGLGRLRFGHVGGGILAPDAARALRGFGVNLKQTYGPAELSGVVALAADGGSLRPAGAAIELRVATGGELWVRSAGMCLGYLDDGGATRDARADDGWWRTGDAGRIGADGALTVAGRLSEAVPLDDGTHFSPEAIETILRGSRFIADAVVPARHRPWVAALIVIDPVMAGYWARDRGIAYTTMADLIAVPALRQLIRDEIHARNELPPPRVRRFALLEPAPSGGTEAGLSRALQRRLLLDANAALAEALFRDDAATGRCIEILDSEASATAEPAHA